MSEEVKEEVVTETPAPDFSQLLEIISKLEKRVEALENQSYILYLQLNGVTKQAIENGSIDKDKLTKDMDELNDQLYKLAQENTDGTATGE